MTPTKTRKAVTPPTTTKVEAKAPVVEKKFTPRFTNKKQEFKASVYKLVAKAKKRNGMPQCPVVSLLKAEIAKLKDSASLDSRRKEDFVADNNGNAKVEIDMATHTMQLLNIKKSPHF